MPDQPSVDSSRCSCENELDRERRIRLLEESEEREDIFDAFVIVLILVYPFLPRFFTWLWNTRLLPFYNGCKEFYGRDSLIGEDPQGTTRFSSEATVVFNQINLNSEDSNQDHSPIIKPDTRIDTRVTPI